MDRSTRGIGRRRFLRDAARAAGAFAAAPSLGSDVVFAAMRSFGSGRAPAVIRQDASRPSVAEGVASGDVIPGRAIVWSRTDRPARMRVEWATTESFRNARTVSGSTATADSGFTARADLTEVPDGQRVFYRVRFEDLADARSVSEPAAGSLLSAPADRRDVTFAWAADTAGQGWGINREWGGMRMFDTIRRARPDFFVHCGDTIYADAPLPAERTLADGTVWKNVVTAAKSKVAETLDEFRGNHRYNLLDEHVRRFNAEVPQVVLWDDHDVRNNWYPGMSLQDDPRYRVKDVARLAAAARQAFFEHVPMRIGDPRAATIYRACPYGPLLEVFALDLRSYRGPNSNGAGRAPAAAGDAAERDALAGRRQIEWLQRALDRSTAMWKVIASDQPIGLIIPDGDGFEATANGDGLPRGRELELAGLLRFVGSRGIRNVVWITGDVHYAAAHHYDPARSRFKDFLPFWEFVAGPLHAGTGATKRLDDTFGPELRFTAVPDVVSPDTGPPSGLQFFGTMHIDGASGTLTVRLHDLAGDTLYSVALEPDLEAR